MRLLTKQFVVSALFLGLAASALKARDLAGIAREAKDIFVSQQASSEAIPVGALARAKAIGIIKVYEGGLVIGGSAGEGVILARTPHGWSAPVFFHQGGTQIGAQAGVHVQEYIYIINSEEALRTFTGSEKSQFRSLAQYTGSTEFDETDLSDGLPPEKGLLVYVRKDGLFAGATLGDIIVGASAGANHKAYGDVPVAEILGGDVPAPEYAKPLQAALGKAASRKGLSKDK